MRLLLSLALVILAAARSTSNAADGLVLPIETAVKHQFATNEAVRIHYVTAGRGPLIVMIHGFPDFWLSWRDQIQFLKQYYQVVAIDQRGYNLSDKPKGIQNYDMKHLVADVAAVIRSAGHQQAIIIGHDWGGAVAWSFAMSKPEMTEKLIVLNMPHPRGFVRELARNPEQQKNSAYAREFMREGSHTNLTAEGLSRWVTDPVAQPRYVEAFKKSDFEAMLHYYKANYPREPVPGETVPMNKVKAPVLMIYGLKDPYLLHTGLNENWAYVDGEFTLVTHPDAGHFVQQDASAFVSRTIKNWLKE